MQALTHSSGHWQSVSFNHTCHSVQRASQRGIKDVHIRAVVAYGQVIYRQGLRFCFIKTRHLSVFSPAMRDQLRNLVGVLAGDSNTVITCYRNKHAPARIRRKSKRLAWPAARG